jgi:rare lipoprotein A
LRAVNLLALIAVVIALCACPSGGGGSKKPTGSPGKPGVQHGIASWYGGKHHGGPTASGERFDKNAMTAAHRTLRMGTRVRVTRVKNGRVVIVRINDRGPYAKGRIIDLSEAAARKLDMIEDGIAKVKVEVIK